MLGSGAGTESRAGSINLLSFGFGKQEEKCRVVSGLGTTGTYGQNVVFTENIETRDRKCRYNVITPILYNII